MNNVAKNLFSLIKYEVCGGEFGGSAEELKNGELLGAVCKLAAEHDMVHLIGGALKKLGLLAEGKLADALGREELKAIFRAERREEELAALTALFDREEIEYIPLKGAVIKGYYPEPWMRTSSDIDILVRERDCDRAAELARSELGYAFEGKTSHDLQLFSPSGVHFELHYSLTEGDQKADGVLAEVWEHISASDGGGCRLCMSDAMFYFYHLAHMAKHIENGGCGIKPVFDLWMFEHNAALDKSGRDELLARGGLSEFDAAVTRLAEAWFSGGARDELTDVLEDYILRAGVYGNLENMVAAGQNKRGGRVRYALSRIFLPYRRLKFHYPILQKHKWLFPFCQVRRWFKLLFCGGIKRSVNELKTNAGISEAQNEATALLFEGLGLGR